MVSAICLGLLYAALGFGLGVRVLGLGLGGVCLRVGCAFCCGLVAGVLFGLFAWVVCCDCIWWCVLAYWLFVVCCCGLFDLALWDGGNGGVLGLCTIGLLVCFI